MAYEVHWQFSFVALNKVKFRVEILQDGYNGDIVTLRGADNPIETSEDNSEDIFTPIRKQTGSLRIADNGYDMDGNEFDYTELIPNDILDLQVRLWQEGNTDTLRWIGYIRPDSLTSRLFDAVNIREFQITCPLGVLYDVPLYFTNDKNDLGTVKTMGKILYIALDSVNINWEYIYKQNNVKHREDLISKISLLNFISKNTPTHSEPSDADTFTAIWRDDSTSWGNVLEEICKFWGWTLYSRGYDIFIIAQYQLSYFTKFAFGDLTSENNNALTDISDVEIDFDEFKWMSTNHTESRKLGYRNIEIDASVNEQSTVIDPDYQKTDFSYYPSGQIVHVSNEYLYVLRRLGTSSGQQNSQTKFFDNYQIFEQRQLQTLGITTEFVLIYSDGWKNDDYTTKTEFDLKKGIVCYKGGQSGVITFFVKTLEDVCIPLNSVICINASAALSYNPDPDFPSDTNFAPPYDSDDKPVLEGRTVTAALKIGDFWWDNANNVWTNTPTTFTLTIRKDGSIVSPLNTFDQYQFNPSGILWDDHEGSSGFCIYVTPYTFTGSGLCGRMKLIIYATAGSPTTYLYNGILNSLSVSIYNQDSKLNPQNKDSQKYEGMASTNFRNNLSVSLKMASGDKNKYGRGQLYNNNLTLLTTIPYRTGYSQYSDVQPEKRMLQLMQDLYSTVTKQNIIEVEDNLQASLPIAQLTGHWSDANDIFRPVCCSHVWRDGKMKLTIINK